MSHLTPESSILDVKINAEDPWVITTAQSTGTVIVWRIDPDTLDVQSSTTTQIAEDPDELVLAVNFSPQDPQVFCATLTSGKIYVCRIQPSGDVVTEGFAGGVGWRIGHLLEAWTSAFGSAGQELGSVLFTGGDDATLMAHDLRAMLSTNEEEPTNIWKARNIHDGGITSILPGGALSTTGNAWSGSKPYHLWTGGYDDKLKSVDLRMVLGELSPHSLPRVADSMDLGGGVWRLIPGPEGTGNRVLACCMYAGARVLEPSDTLAKSVKTIVDGHESMVYGADWSADGRYAATCSFYDKAVQVWEP